MFIWGQGRRDWYSFFEFLHDNPPPTHCKISLNILFQGFYCYRGLNCRIGINGLLVIHDWGGEFLP